MFGHKQEWTNNYSWLNFMGCATTGPYGLIRGHPVIATFHYVQWPMF